MKQTPTAHLRIISKAGMAFLAIGALLSAAPLAVQAQAYPTKTIRTIIPYAPGGSTDAAVRRITGAMNLGQQIIVENKPGAGTLIGTREVIEAAPDGHTLGFVTAALTQGHLQMSSWNIDPVRQLTPIAAVINVPVVFFVNPAKANVRTMSEYIALAKSRPTIFASSGGSDILAMHQFNRMAGTNTDIVNFKGEANVILSMLRGDADIAMSALGSVRQHIANGTLRPLAVSGLQRSPMYPDVPTVDESGVKGYSFTSWSGFVAPANTPRPIIERLNKAIVAAVRTPEISKFVTDSGNSVIGNTPEEFGRMISSEIAKWTDIAKVAGIKPQ